jgi:hypothetical protein
MIILDDSFVSERMRAYLECSQQPVLATDMARGIAACGRDIVLVEPTEAVRRVDAGERLYAQSESRLAWVTSHVGNPDILHGIEVFKDKERMRKMLAPLYPDYFFAACSVDELVGMEYPAHAAPFVLKPSIGFLSIGVYAIGSREQWEAAIADIRTHRADWTACYDESVIGGTRFIIESSIEGTEYALDAYYDEWGDAHLLDILRHDFADPADTSDRLYVTSASIVREKSASMLAFLRRVNDCAHVKNLPVHVEVRECDGAICPIEFNPLRFAGLGGTEISDFAYGFFAFDCYLRGEDPDWDAVLPRCDDRLYCMSVLNPPPGLPSGMMMDYRALASRFAHPLAIERFDRDSTGIFGFMFWKTDPGDSAEREFLLRTDLREFLRNG